MYIPVSFVVVFGPFQILQARLAFTSAQNDPNVCICTSPMFVTGVQSDVVAC